ncbi:MAG: peptidase M23 [Pseudonocardiaceae bacterium]
MPIVPAAKAMPKLEKAYLSLLTPTSPAKGGKGGKIDQINFRFNPNEYTIQKSANWKRTPLPNATEVTVPEFTGADPRSLTLEIFLDETESANGSVAKDIEKLFDLCTPTKQSISAKKPSPPFVLFGWGSTTSFTAYVKSVSVKYSMFHPDGTVMRATGNLSLEEVPSSKAKQNPTSGTLASHRTHTVVDGDNLPLIAFREYRDPTYWRAIAETNGIDDPMRLPSGTHLLIPSGDEAATRV